ncbi:MAG: DNA polymerase I [Armatimonadota bacterium]|nr:DNA polymerase I [Armatimonadota bacterium]MDR7454247.1 DNA polymerase I [Armatimonadota bacterium]MDR7457488.1 DNA polymerase I [Armatimonadota bacterium]
MAPTSDLLVLLDTNGLIYRAFYALPYLTTSGGRPTNAVYGFTTMLLKVLDEERPDYVAAAFDRPEPTFRHREYAAYKAHREAMPDDLRPQIGLSRQVLEALRIPAVDAPGFEADDVIATLARRAAAQGLRVLVVSGDLDTLQLVDDHIRVMVTSRGITETVVYDAERVRQRFGFDPAQLPDYKSLRGDPSDNIPGVPGVGEKTASALVQKFGSVEALYAHLELVAPRTRAALAAAREQVLQSKQLATLVADAPVEVDWEALRRRPPDRQRLAALFRELEFRGLLDRVAGEDGSAAPGTPEGLPARAGDVSTPLDAATSAATSTPAEGPDAVVACVAGATEIGIAFVRGDGHPLVAPVEAVAVAADGRAAWMAAAGGLPEGLRRALADPSVRKISADLKADLLTLRRLAMPAAGFDFDVGIASYVLNPGRRTHSLETAAREFLHVEVPDDDAAARAASAASALLRLRPVLEERMRAREVESLFRDVEVPLAAVLAAMEEAGVAVDIPYLTALGEELAGRLAALEAEIYRLAGTEFNLGSPKQLGFVLFEKLQLPPLKRTKTGFSTDADVLQSLAPRHEVVAKVLEHRELAKLKSTYVDVLPRLADPQTGRVHTTFNQTYAATGRVITEAPNLQNLPIRSEEGRKIRRAVVAPDGCALLSVDYSQIDLRVLAHITRDPGLVGAFERGEDVHTVTAAEVFGVPGDRVTPELRRRAKAIVFGVAYGMSEHGLAAQLGIAREEARAFIDAYYARFPRVREYMLRVVEEARRDGYVTTVLNRRRYLPDLQSRNRQVREAAERTAINTPIQGSSADIIKLAMLAIAREVLPAAPGVRMTLQVHDELLFEVPSGQVEDVAARVRARMEAAFPLSVPLVAEAKAGPSWAEMRPVA